MSRVSHPLLRLEVLQPDGSHETGHRVFCRYQRRSIAAGTCCACAHCDEVTTAPEPAVVCSVPLAAEELESDEVGGLLRGQIIALGLAASIGQARAILLAEERHSLAVVDEKSVLVGVVHETAFTRRVPSKEEVVGTMSSGLAIHESTPVRRALRLLASAHLREAIVIDDRGVPLGTFRDVDGLHWLAHARRFSSRELHEEVRQRRRA